MNNLHVIKLLLMAQLIILLNTNCANKHKSHNSSTNKSIHYDNGHIS